MSPDVEHLRLLIDLRRLDVPLGDAGKMANWCHSGHCADTTAELPRLIGQRRADIADRIAGLTALDAPLVDLNRHLTRRIRSLRVLAAGGPCCDARVPLDHAGLIRDVPFHEGRHEPWCIATPPLEDWG